MCNQRVWSDSKSHYNTPRKQLQKLSVNVWVGILCDYIIGPYILLDKFDLRNIQCPLGISASKFISSCSRSPSGEIRGLCTMKSQDIFPLLSVKLDADDSLVLGVVESHELFVWGIWRIVSNL